MENKKYCINCGNEIISENSYCTNCGKKISSSNQEKEDNSQNQTRKIICPKCQSNIIQVQAVSNTYSIKKGHGCAYWIFIGWWLELILWIFFTIPRILIALFMPKRQKIVSEAHTIAVCQSCGYSWNIGGKL